MAELHCLFVLMLYVPVKNFSDEFLTSTKQRISVLLKDTMQCLL